MTDADELRRRARQHETVFEESGHDPSRLEHRGIAEGYRRAADLLEDPPMLDTLGHRVRRADTHTIVETTAADTVRRRTYQPAGDHRDAPYELVVEEYNTAADEWHTVGCEPLQKVVVDGEERLGAGDVTEQEGGG